MTEGGPAKSAVAYLFRDRLLISPIVRTTAGVGLEIEPVLVVSASAGDEVVGAELLTALHNSGHVVAHPRQDQWKALTRPIVHAAGARSYRAFALEALTCQLEVQAGTVAIQPYRNEVASRQGFVPITEAVLMVPLDDGVAAKLGNALREALRIAAQAGHEG